MESYKARLDIRGFIRFSKELAEKFKLKNTPYADVLVDKAGSRIAIVPTSKIKTSSYRFLQSNGTFLLYLRSAMNAVGMKICSGDAILTKEGDKIIFQKKGAKKTGTENLLACRKSAGLPMISIDQRGTMILDKRCITAINTIKNPVMTPEYDAKKKTFRFTFGKKGLVNVRTIESHASMSMMGTFHSFGVQLPESHVRYSVQISGQVMTLKLE